MNERYALVFGMKITAAGSWNAMNYLLREHNKRKPWFAGFAGVYPITSGLVNLIKENS